MITKSHLRSGRLLLAALFTLGLSAQGAPAAEPPNHGHGAPRHGDVPNDGKTPPVAETRQSGHWSSPETWADGNVPTTGDRVLIRAGHDVVYDVVSNDVIRGICVSGTLAFARDRDTELNVGLIRIEAGNEYSEIGFDCQHPPAADSNATPRAALEVGMPNATIPAEHTALIRLHYIEGMDKESCPAIVCCGGRMDLHGAPMERTWVKLPYVSAEVGQTKVILPHPLKGWEVGDRVVITGTTRQVGFLGTRDFTGEDNSVRQNPTSEERVITDVRPWWEWDVKRQIFGFDRPLEFNHTCVDGYRAEVANLSRNVVIESADPDGVRGHTMYHRGSAGSISYAEFRHLGKKGVLGRYPIHYHLVADTMRGSSIIGASIWDSHNHFITIHGTQYLVVRDCVGYRSVGHGFFLEDGTEVYNVLDRNLAIQALGGPPLPDRFLPYDENRGSGFWWANSLNTWTRNVAVECDEDGFRFEAVDTDAFDPRLPILQPDGTRKKIDIRTQPFVRFEGNESHCQRMFGMNLGGFSRGNHNKPNADVGGVGPDPRHPFLIRDFKVWDAQWALQIGSPCVLIDGADIHNCTHGFWRSVMHRHKYRSLSMTDVNYPIFYPRAAGEADYDYPIGSGFVDLDPVDDLPPVTIITHMEPTSESQVVVRGTTSDDYEVQEVTVNGRPAQPTRANFAQWHIRLPIPPNGELSLVARAEDAADNIETSPHERQWREQE